MKPLARVRSLAAFAALLLVASCGPKTQLPLGRLDTPEHHAFTGFRLFEQEKYISAAREFDRALRQDPENGWAHAGTALVRAHQGDIGGAREAIRQGVRVVWSDEARVYLAVVAIRVQILGHSPCLAIGAVCGDDPGWLETAREAFERAVRIDPRSDAAHYFMGEAYLAALDFDRAGWMYGRVLEINRDHVAEADRRWALLRKIRQAKPASETGKKAALRERVTRAEIAALLVDELKSDSPEVVKGGAGIDTAAHPAGTEGGAAGTAVAADTAGHPLRAAVGRVIRAGVRGLDPLPDGRFRPDGLVDRATLALILEGILERSGKAVPPAPRSGESRPPFPDLRPDQPGYGAVVAATARGLIGAVDGRPGVFLPLDPVTGVDALLAIRKTGALLQH